MGEPKNKTRLALASQTGLADDDHPQEENSHEDHTVPVAVEQHLWPGLRPVPFDRPRFDRRSGRVFGAARYEKYKREMRRGCRPTHGPLDAPCEALVVFGMGPPGKTPKWRWQEFLAGRWRNTRKPDIDNLTKAVLDAMNGVLWKDDSQVFRLAAEKVFSEEFYVEITVRWFKQAAR